MNIALVGFGTMGQALWTTARNRGHHITSVIDPTVVDDRITHRCLDEAALVGCDVAIEFSAPEGIEERIALYARVGKPAVVATTGWYDKLAELQNTYGDAAIMWSGNFSIGVQLFYLIVRNAARLFDHYDEYDVLVNEWFHAKKADSPSGTAATLGAILIEELGRKDSAVTARLDRRRKAGEVHISSTRGGYTAGEHTIIFDSPGDTITLKHAARSREGYLSGALVAAAWIVDGTHSFCSFEEALTTVVGMH